MAQNSEGLIGGFHIENGLLVSNEDIGLARKEGVEAASWEYSPGKLYPVCSRKECIHYMEVNADFRVKPRCHMCAWKFKYDLLKPKSSEG